MMRTEENGQPARCSELIAIASETERALEETRSRIEAAVSHWNRELKTIMEKMEVNYYAQ